MPCLVIKNDGIGDLVLASGVIASLAEHFGGVHLVTCEQNREIAGMIPGVTKVFLVSRDDLVLRHKPLRLRMAWPKISRHDGAVLREIAREQYEVAICLRRYIRTNSFLIMRAVKAKQRIACWLFPTNLPVWAAQRLNRGWALFRGSQAGSETLYYQAALKDALGITLSAQPRLTPEADLPAPESGTIGLSIGGAVKRWPEDRWATLARNLVDRGFKVRLLGGSDCTELARTIVAQVPSVTSRVGSLSLQDTIPLLAKMELLISNDTGLAHFASLYCQRILVIQGGGGFGRFFPWPNQANQYLIYHGVECFDCDWVCPFPEKFCFTCIPAHAVANFAGEIVTQPATVRIRNLNPQPVAYRLNWAQPTAKLEYGKIGQN